MLLASDGGRIFHCCMWIVGNPSLQCRVFYQAARLIVRGLRKVAHMDPRDECKSLEGGDRLFLRTFPIPPSGKQKVRQPHNQ